ncbi:SIR2 family protein [Chloroflexota bacterium]
MKDLLNNDYSEQDFISHFVQNAQHLMWFLGAGTSRTAGIPSATDIVWELKRKYYCLHENQDLQSHDIHNKAIQRKIQNYLDSKGFPSPMSAEEYSFYFDLTFGDDYSSQQKFIVDQLDPRTLSLNIGHRVLAALLEMGLTRVIFTTNFDEVIETAYSAVTGRNLSPFHIEGAYAALDALNAEQFPIYAKIHGDFRYRSIKNLSSDLLRNDQELQKCFLAASNRFGLVVSGYSGRDNNVMEMLMSALDQNNPFPQGLFWITPHHTEVANSVTELITSARDKGVLAHIIETGTFDIILSKIWRQIPEKPNNLDLKVRTTEARKVSIPLPPPGSSFPILRTNALAITEYPQQCGKVDYTSSLTFPELREKTWEHNPDTIWTYTDQLLFWGNPDEIYKIINKDKVTGTELYNFDNSADAIAQSGFIKSFFEQALAQALCYEKPILLRRKRRTYYAVVSQKDGYNPILQPLKDTLGYQGKPGSISGSVPGSNEVFWAEALSIKLEENNGLLWLMIRPDIWISPLKMREDSTEFLRKKKAHRYNNQSYQLLDAWIRILFGSVGSGEEVLVSCYPDTAYSAPFKISTRTAFSRSGGLNG